MKIIATDNAGSTLATEVPEQNIWIEVERSDGVGVYVGSLFFEERPDGSLAVQWGTVRNGDDWFETEEVIVPASELAPANPENMEEQA